jgi:RHS repeat-associated protein
MALRTWPRIVAILACAAAGIAEAQGGAVVEARGEATYRIPIVVPPGPAGHQPELALVYTSGEGRGAAGWLGFGWALEGESRIERESRTGSPYDYANATCGASGVHPCYRASYVLDGEDLICSAGACSACSAGAPCRYRTQADDGRLIEFLGDGSGWRIRDRDGRTLVYGAASDGSTRLANPASIIGQVYSWQLERSTDVSGNTIRYGYDTTSSANVAYLKRVEYGQGTMANRSIEFVLNHPSSAARPDRPVSARTGFRQQTDRRVASIVVRAAADALVTRYELSYVQDADSTRSQLASVQRVGSDGVTSLPPYRFDYSFRHASRGLLGGFEPSFAAAPSCNPGGGQIAATPPGGVLKTIADVNNDGLGDLYQVENTHSALPGGVGVALGTGRELRPGPGGTCSPSSGGVLGTPWSPRKLLFSETNGGSAALDFDGDGHLDHLWLGGFPFPEVTWGLRLGSESGFLEPSLGTSFERSVGNAFTAGNYTFDRPYIRIAETSGSGHVDVIAAMTDVTADGRPDLVVSSFAGPLVFQSGGTWTGWAVFVNRGLATMPAESYLDFGFEPTRWVAPANAAIQHDYLGFASESLLADQNGDGLADSVFWGLVEYGYGAGFLPPESVASPTGSLVVNSTCLVTGTFDLNGDGFLDHVNAQPTHAGNPNWRVHFGTGHGFAAQSRWFPADGGGINPMCLEADGQNAASTSLRDMNGDGIPDRLRDPFGVMLNAGALDPNAVGDPDLPSAALAGLLLRATDPLGGVVEFTYQTAPQMRDQAGMPANPGFAQTRPVVTRLVVRDGRAGTPAITTGYAYSDGAFDPAEKEFRGFGTVVATQVENGADAARTTSTYRTDRACAFGVATVETADGAGVLARESTSHQVVSGGGEAPDAWAKCLPVERIEEAVEGDEAAKRVRRTSFGYGSPIDPNYNLARLEEWGEWHLAGGHDVPGDERITEFSYATPSSAWPSIVSRVKLETVRDLAGNVYAKRQTCYFSAACIFAGNGRPLVIKEYLTDHFAEPPIVDVAKTVSTIVYDAYGNPIHDTGPGTTDDPDGLRTTITYDATYRTLPISIARGSDVSLPLRPLVTALAYDGCAGGLAPPTGLGLPCSIDAPGGGVERLGYDALGRVIRVERPASGYLETRSHALPGATSPGENVLETRIVRAAAADLVERQHLDGLGRVHRHESPGRGGETIVVERAFDARGHLRTESLPYSEGSPLLRTFAYDGLGRPTLELDADGETLRARSYAPWTAIDETYLGGATPGHRAQRTERSADGLGRPVRVAQFEDAVAAATPYVVTARYDAADRLYELRDAIANDVSLCAALEMGPHCATQDHVTELAWDTLGRRVRIDDPDSGVWSFRYDDAGRLKQRAQNAGTFEARTQSFSYDALGRPSARTFAPAGSGVANASFHYENDAASPGFARLVEVRSAGPTATSYVYGYDASGRRDSVIQRSAGLEFGTAWEYDELDRVKRRLFPDGEAFDYAYDGLRLREIRADGSNSAFQGKVLAHADHDALGRMRSIAIGQRANGSPIATQAFGYDAANARLARITGTAGGGPADDPDGDAVDASSDRCPHAYDPARLDRGGIGDASGPDGIGDACQCGDVDGSGRVTVADALAILTAEIWWEPVPSPELCDVDGDDSCEPGDFFAVMAALSSGSADLQHCPAARPANTPSSEPLDLNVRFDGLGRLTSQTGSLGGEPVSRSYSYDGLSRLRTAVGPWEQGRGESEAVTWTWTYDALGNLRSQTSSRPSSAHGEHRAWHYYDPSKPRFLSQYARAGELWETISSTSGGEPAAIAVGTGHWTETLAWNALGKLHRYGDSSHHYDAFGGARLTITGAPGSSASIVRVGEDFEYEIGAQRANKSFSIDGVRIATLATSYAAESAGTPPVLRFASRLAKRLAPPVALALLAASLVGLASVALRHRASRWLEATGVGVLSCALVAWPHAALAAMLSAGPGRYGRHAEPILACLSDQLGSIRAIVNQDGVVVETRDYAPFGESIAHTGAFSLQHRFNGQPQDDQADGLYDYGARFYDPAWGRFISPDDVVQSIDSQGLNPYSYVLNRPTSATDPTGRMIWNGVSFGAWSVSTLQSGVLQSNPSSFPAQAHGASFAAGFHSFARPMPAFLGIMGESVVRPTAEFLLMLSKVLFTDLQAAWFGAISQLIFNPFLALGELIDATVNADPVKMRNAAWRLVRGTLVPRYGLQNGPYWGRGKSTNERLDSVLDDAGYVHDDMCNPACSSAADRAWIKIAWSDPWRLGPYGQAYRLLGTAAFGSRILFRATMGTP